MIEKRIEAIVKQLSGTQRQTLLGIAGVDDRITVQTDDFDVFQRLGLTRDRDGELELTEVGERVVEQIQDVD